MRLAVVHSRYRAAEPSGENAAVDDQVQALLGDGHDVRLFDRATDDVATSRAYPLRAALTTLTGVGSRPDLTVDGWRPDVVHVHNTFPNWGTRWTRDWSPRLVLTLHNYRTVCAAATLFRDGHACHDCLAQAVLPAVRNGCYRGSRAQTVPLAIASAPRGNLRRVPIRAARVIALNVSAQETFRRLFDRPVDLIPNFVTSVPTVPPSNDGWVYVGRLTSEKGVVELLSSWPAGRHLDVFGSGPSEHAVKRLAAARPTELTFHGLVPRDTLRSRLGGYSGLLLPSLCPEGLPTVALESISAGTPLVVSDRVAAAGAFEQAGAAITYDPSDPSSLTLALDRVAGDQRAFRERSRWTFLQTYSRDAWLENITSVYKDVAGRSGDAHR